MELAMLKAIGKEQIELQLGQALSLAQFRLFRQH